jgi:hypothetical protein
LIAAFGRHGKSAQHREKAETDQANGEKSLRHMLPHPRVGRVAALAVAARSYLHRLASPCLSASALPDILNFP